VGTWSVYSFTSVIWFDFQSDHEDLVENSAVGGHQNLEVRSKPLPDTFQQLIMSVTTEFGPPILYAKTGRASTLRLLVATTRSKAGKFINYIAIVPVISSKKFWNVFCYGIICRWLNTWGLVFWHFLWNWRRGFKRKIHHRSVINFSIWLWKMQQIFLGHRSLLNFVLQG